MTNHNPETGIPYGVIACNSLDSDLVQELWYTHGTDLSYEEALAELRQELEAEADEIEAGETPDDDTYLPTGYGDREAFIEGEMDCRSQNIQIDEPTIEGEYEGVKYHISWLGGAPLLWASGRRSSTRMRSAHPAYRVRATWILRATCSVTTCRMIGDEAMIKVTKGGKVSTFSDILLPHICLEVAGGGYASGQTVKAMRLQGEVLEKGKGYLGAVTVEKGDEKP